MICVGVLSLLHSFSTALRAGEPPRNAPLPPADSPAMEDMPETGASIFSKGCLGYMTPISKVRQLYRLSGR